MKNVIFFRLFINCTMSTSEIALFPHPPEVPYHILVFIRNFFEISVSYSCKNCTRKKILGPVQSIAQCLLLRKLYFLDTCPFVSAALCE